MSSDKPTVSIGMPVYNGANYIEEAIQSILNQTYSDFELIISDNASTDATGEICQAYVKQDSRILYCRNNKNLGAAKNANRTFTMARGDYFKLAAHDDLIAPEFLEKCVGVLKRDSSVVLCYTRTRFIDTNGDVLSNCDLKLNRVGSSRPQDRFADLILIDYWCLEIFGLIQSRLLEKTPVFGSYIASDRVLLAELGLLGRFHELPEYLFFSRQHPEQSIQATYLNFRGEWFDSENSGIAMPHWRIFFEYLKSVSRVSIRGGEKLACYLHMLRWFGANVHWARLLADVILAVNPQSVKFIRKAENWYYNYTKRKLKNQGDLRRNPI